ncbi:MAG: hypothetical protein ACRDT2_10865, partial [Natronosporangium sp.]
PEPAVDEEQLAHAAAVWREHLAGQYTPDQERVEAALELLRSLEEDPPPDPEKEEARLVALRRLAAALPAPAAPGGYG